MSRETSTPPLATDIAVTESQAMPDPPRRRFTLSDVMILVATTAPSLVLLRIANGLGLFTGDPKSPWGREFIEHLSITGGSILFPLSLAVLVLSLRDRLSTRRDIFQGAGFVACVIVLLAAVLPIAYFVARVGMADELNFSNELSLNFNNSFGRLKNSAGPMITGAWLALALTGRWRPNPTWIDRLGCLTGFCFMFIYFYDEFYFLVMPLFHR